MRQWTTPMTALLACVFVLGCSEQGVSPSKTAVRGPTASVDRGMAATESAADWGEDTAACEEPAAGYFDPLPAEAEHAEPLRSPMPELADVGPSAGETPAGPGVTEDFAAPAREPASRPAKTSPPRRHRTEPERRRQIQSGTLTAGSFDDVENFDDYRQFLNEAMQADAAETLPRVAAGDRAMIHVVDAQGRPVGGARVTVHLPDPQRRAHDPPQQPALVELLTGSDGRAMFLPGMEGHGPGHDFLVAVIPPDGTQAVVREAKLDGEPWHVTLPQTEGVLPQQLDLALVVDTTGSMGDELEYLKAEIDSIAQTIYEMFPNVDQRYSLVAYRDQRDQYVVRTYDFTRSLGDFRGTLSAQSAGGGGDEPEAMHLALEQAGKLSWRGGDAARVLFLVADAPPHAQHGAETVRAIDVLRGRGVRMFPVASSGVHVEAEFVMRAAAFMTLGQYLFLTDHSGVGLPHARPHVPSFQVERLDRLMVRMIASELTGRRLVPEEVIAIEGTGEIPPLPQQAVPPEQQQTGCIVSPPPAARWALAGWLPPRWTALVVLAILAFGADLWERARR